MPDASLQRKLRNWQMLLLDLTRANRLLYFKAERGSSVPITSPASAELFQLLVDTGQATQISGGGSSARCLKRKRMKRQSIRAEPAERAVKGCGRSHAGRRGHDLAYNARSDAG